MNTKIQNLFKYKLEFILLILLSFLKSILFALSFFSIYQIFSTLLSNDFNLKNILFFSFLSLLSVFLNITLNFLYKLKYKSLIFKLVSSLNSESIQNIVSFNPYFLQQKSEEEILYHSTELPNQISNFFYEPIFLLIEDLIKFLILTCLLFYFHWLLGIISIFSGIILILYFNFTLFKMTQYDYEIIELEKKNRVAIEYFLKLHNDFFYLNQNSKWFLNIKKILTKNHKNMFYNSKKYYLLNFLNQIILGIFISLPIILISIFLYLDIYNFELSTFIISFILIGIWVKILTDIYRTIPAFKLAKDVEKELALFQNNEIKNAVNTELSFSTLKLENVSYISAKNKRIKKINIEIKENDKLAIIGKSGIGKSVLVNIISKNNSINYTGEIYWNNINIKDLSHKQIVSNLTLLDSDNLLLDTSFLNNVTLFDSNIDNEKIKKILKLFKLEEFHYKNEISNMSEGQKQRLNLIRILLNSKNKILILDEAFNNLDKNTANIIRKILMKNSKIYIEVSHHLLEEIKNFNHILEIKNE